MNGWLRISESEFVDLPSPELIFGFYPRPPIGGKCERISQLEGAFGDNHIPKSVRG